jgi:hypothetical protein
MTKAAPPPSPFIINRSKARSGLMQEGQTEQALLLSLPKNRHNIVGFAGFFKWGGLARPLQIHPTEA